MASEQPDNRAPVQRGIGLAIATLAIILAVIAGFIFWPRHPEKATGPLRFAALGNQVITAPAIVAVKENRFDGRDLDVASFDVSAGIFAKDAVAEGNADVAIVANAPLVIAAAKGQDVVLLGRIMYSDKIHAVISRISPHPVPQPIGYIPGTSSEFFLRKVLRASNLSDELSQYKTVSLRPPGMLATFNAGSVESAVIWEPFVSEISRSKTPPFEVKPGLRVNKYPGLYPFQMYLVTSRAAWKEKHSQIVTFVATLREVCNEMVQAPKQSQAKLEAILGYRTGWLNSFWNDMDFSFSADDAVLLPPLEDDGKLAVEAGIVKSLPDFKPLFEILPYERKMLQSSN